jgi:hypothetical protein
MPPSVAPRQLPNTPAHAIKERRKTAQLSAFLDGCCTNNTQASWRNARKQLFRLVFFGNRQLCLGRWGFRRTDGGRHRGAQKCRRIVPAFEVVEPQLHDSAASSTIPKAATPSAAGGDILPGCHMRRKVRERNSSSRIRRRARSWIRCPAGVAPTTAVFSENTEKCRICRWKTIRGASACRSCGRHN